MERKAIVPPRSCFGLEQLPTNRDCPQCPYREDCADLMGDMVGTVEIDAAQFRLLPENLAERFNYRVGSDPDISDFKYVYESCYKWVFDCNPGPEKLYKHIPFVQQAAQELGVSVKLFLLANMLGWRMTHAEFAETNKFALASVSNQSGIDCVKTYSDLCRKKYGTFDAISLDRLMDSDTVQKDIAALLLNSEIIFGSWIVNYKLYQSGNIVEKFYREKETAMNPYWLATEQTYVESLWPSITDEYGQVTNKLVERHRWAAKQTKGLLKRRQLTALRVFRLREQIMPEAIRRVLGQRGLLAEHFRIVDTPQVSPLKFWVRLGNAIQHYECLKFTENYPSAYDNRFVRLKSVL